MSKILISGYHGFGNYGDEAILLAIKNNLSKALPNVQMTVLSPKPEETARAYGIGAVNRYNPFEIFKGIYEADLLISGGGSLLQDVTSTRSLIYYLTLISVAKLLGKKVMLYANGIGPIQKSFNQWITRKIVNRIDVITVRDKDSYEELLNMNIHRPKIQITADPVFTFYKDLEVNLADGILEKENIPKDRPLIGISVRQWNEEESFISCMAQLCDYIKEKYDVNILFIPMQLSKDFAISTEIQNRMKHKSYIISKEYSIEQMIQLVSKLHLMISMRLHTLIFSGVKGIPMLGIVYDPKVANYLKLVNQPIGMDVSHIDFEAFKKQVDAAMQNYDALKESLQNKIELLYEKAKQNDTIVMELLKQKDGVYEK